MSMINNNLASLKTSVRRHTTKLKYAKVNILVNKSFEQNDWKPKVRKWINLQDLRNEYVLLYPEGRVVLNKSSYDILKLCNGENTIEKITELIAYKYFVNPKIICEDITNFIYESKNLLWFD